MTHRLHSYLGYSYPGQLTELVKRAWPADLLTYLPTDWQLRLLLDVAYHASLLREEQRPVTFRLLFGPPDDVVKSDQPPTALSGVSFDRPRPFNEQEVRRISMAADFFRSLVAVAPYGDEKLKIWGILLSGTRWVNSVDGGRFTGYPLPTRVVIHALGPGRITVFVGHRRIAALSGGQLEAYAFDLFQSTWLRESFAAVRKNMQHWLVQEETNHSSITVDVDLLRAVSQNVIRRTLSVVRNAKHGGTLVFIDPDDEGEFTTLGGPMRFKYLLAKSPQRNRYRQLIKSAVIRLCQLAITNHVQNIGWNEYQGFADRQLGELDEAFFEFAHFLGDLMAVDGALVLTKQYEIIGFGAELLSEAPCLSSVRRAMDLEATIWANESLDDVGTRHRAVYRLCDQHRKCLAIVISQDGSVRFVKNHNGTVTYWNQISW
jgi:DisA bacterial checkpoint controller nucleotide-binding